jgi:hypothetical protein
MSKRAILPFLILTAGATLAHAQGLIEYGVSAGRSGAAAGAAGAGRSATTIFNKVNSTLAGSTKTGEDTKGASTATSAPSVITAKAAPAATPPPPPTPQPPADFTALALGMDRADLFKKVGKPSMSMSGMESSKAIETCWYKNGPDTVTIIVSDGKVTSISGYEKPAAQ